MRATMLVIAAFLWGCAVTIEVTPEDGAVVTAPGLDDCEGVEVDLTVRGSGPSGAARTTHVKARVADGELAFESRSLRDFDLSKPVTLVIRIVSRPEPPCEFSYLAAFVTDPVVLTPAGDRRYTVPASSFRPM